MYCGRIDYYFIATVSPPMARDSGEALEIISEKMSKSKKNGVNPQVGILYYILYMVDQDVCITGHAVCYYRVLIYLIELLYMKMYLEYGQSRYRKIIGQSVVRRRPASFFVILTGVAGAVWN